MQPVHVSTRALDRREMEALLARHHVQVRHGNGGTGCEVADRRVHLGSVSCGKRLRARYAERDPI